MSRVVVTGMAVGAVLAVSMLTGCGDGGAGSASPSGPEGVGRGPGSLAELTPIPKSGGGANRVVFLLPAEPTTRELIWKEAAQLEASKRTEPFASRSAAAGESMAGLIRRVAREGGGTLIVVVDDAEAVGEAIAEARGRGIRALTILEPVTAAGEPVPAVVRTDYAGPADELVAAAAIDAGRLGKSPEGPALVVHLDDFPEADNRARALYEALGRAGIEAIGDGPVAVSRDPDRPPGEGWIGMAAGGSEPRIVPDRHRDVVEVIVRTLAERPDLAMVLAGDDTSFLASVLERSERTGGTGMAVAGFVVDPENLDLVKYRYASAAAFADERVLGIYAFRHAVSLAKGDAVPDRIVAPMPVRVASGPPAFGRLRTEPVVEESALRPFDPSRRGGPGRGPD